MSLWIILGALLLSLASSGGAYIYGLGVGEAKMLARQSAQDTLIREVIDASTQAAAAEIAKIKVRHVTVNQQLQKEIQERTIYTECHTGPSVVSLFNSIAPPSASASEPTDSRSLPGESPDSK